MLKMFIILLGGFCLQGTFWFTKTVINSNIDSETVINSNTTGGGLS